MCNTVGSPDPRQLKHRCNTKLGKRVLSAFLAVVLAVSVVAYQPPKAEAFAPAIVIPVAAAAFMAAAGLTWVVNGQDGDSFVDSVSNLLQSYLDINFGGESITDWAGDVALSALNGKLLIPKLLAEKFGAFAAWAVKTLSLSEGAEKAVPSLSYVWQNFSSSFDVAAYVIDFSIDGQMSMNLYSTSTSNKFFYIYSIDAFVPAYSGSYTFVCPYSSAIASMGSFAVLRGNTTDFTAGLVSQKTLNLSSSSMTEDFDGVFTRTLTKDEPVYISYQLQTAGKGVYSAVFDRPYVYYQDPTLSLQQAGMVSLPDTDAMTDGQALALDAGTADTDTDSLLQSILDAIIANNLTISQAITDTGTGTGIDDGTLTWTDTLWGWLTGIKDAIIGLPQRIADVVLTWTDTLWGWLTDIKDAIIGLPTRIAEAVKALFVPDEAFFPTAVAELQDTFKDRMGLLTYPASVLFNFFDRVVNIQEQEPILRWDDVVWMDHVIIPGGEFNFNDTLDTPSLKTAHDAYLIAVNAALIIGFLALCYKKYRSIVDH